MEITGFSVAPVKGTESGGGSFHFGGECGPSATSLGSRAFDLADMGLGEEMEVESEGGELNEPEDGGREDHRDLGATDLDAEEDGSEELCAECHQGQNQTEHQVDRLRQPERGTKTEQSHPENGSDHAVGQSEGPERREQNQGENGGDSKLQGDFGNLSVHVGTPMIEPSSRGTMAHGQCSWRT